MRKQRSLLMTIVVFVLILPASVRVDAAGEEETTVVVATPSRVAVGSPIEVEGRASFGPDETVVARDDYGGNRRLPPVSDLVAAFIKSDPARPDMLSFEIELAGLVDDSIAPGIEYHWSLAVDGAIPWGDPSWAYAERGGIRFRIEPFDTSLQPRGHLYACSAGLPAECVWHEQPMWIDAKQRRLGLELALDAISASPGSAIEAGPAHSYGHVWTSAMGTALLKALVVTRAYRVPDRSVELAVVGSAEPVPSRFPLRVPVASDGSFVAAIPTDDLRLGPQDVVARACWGDACATARSRVTLTGPSGPPDRSCLDPDDSRYASYECKVQRLRERSFVVIAVPDSGINPYHVDFRLDPDDDLNDVPPWEFIDGFPSHARALDLTLDATDYEAAITQDAETLGSLDPAGLYFVPGTSIIGMVPRSTSQGIESIDMLGHGTQVASLAAGRIHGIAPDRDVLVVAVNGTNTGLAWTASRPWIDVVTNSWGWPVPLGLGTHRTSRTLSDEGKAVVFAGGNGISRTGSACDRGISTISAEAGPSWVVTVGAVSPRNHQNYCWHSIPVDVVSYGAHWPAADHRSMEGSVEFDGTSNAAPIVAGAIASQILRARRILGDTGSGPREGGVLALAAPDAAPPADGPLADGDLTRAEAEALVLKTAFPAPFDALGLVEDPFVTPTTPAYYLTMGYGIVNRDSIERATAVLRGEAPLPDRADVDAWIAAKDAAADVIWADLLR